MPAVMFVVKFQVDGMLQAILGPAFSKAQFQAHVEMNKANDDLNDPQLRLDLSWREVAGKRFERVRRFVTSEWIAFVMLVLLIGVEGFRIIAHFLMAA